MVNSHQTFSIDFLSPDIFALDGIDEPKLLLDKSPGQSMTWASMTKPSIDINVQEESSSDELLDSLFEKIDNEISKSLLASLEDSPVSAECYEFNTANSAEQKPVYSASIFNDAQRVIDAEYTAEYTSHIFEDTLERIWKSNDQKASLFLQERLQQAVPGELEKLIALVLNNSEILMVHRFGNFSVQSMLEVAQPDDLSQFACLISNRIAKLSKNEFCCHVIQRLLDVGFLVIQARVAAELLDDIIDTMMSPFGTHVWQKLLRLPWPTNMPPITKLANNAVHLEPNTEGWMTITRTEAGCATIRSFLAVARQDDENQECSNELLVGLPKLILQPAGSTLIPRLAVLSPSRSRAMTMIISKAREYCTHPVASTVILLLSKMKIPSFPARLNAAIAKYQKESASDTYGHNISVALGVTTPH